MPNLIIDLRRIGHRLGDFIAEKAAVTLPEAVHEPFHGRLGHSESMRERRIRYVLALRTQARAQRFKSAQPSLAFAFLAQTPQRLFDHGRRPPQIEKALSGPGFHGLGRDRKLRRRFRHPVIPGDELDVAAPLARMAFLRRIVQEVLERLEQERAEPAPGGIGVLKPITFEHHDKKILGKVLRIGGGMTAPANEREDGTPIEPAKFREGLARLLIAGSEIGRGENETPARRREVASFAAPFRRESGVHEPR